jgi:drug/metabolite transporter (DMT)-like permease
MTQQTKAYLFAVAVVLIWSTVASAFKITLRFIDYQNLVFYSVAVSLLTLLVILLVQKKQMLLVRCTAYNYAHSALLGLLNPFVYYLVLFRAYSLLPAQEAQPLNQTWAIIIAVLSIIILRQKISAKSIGAIVISFVGVVIISTRGNILQLRLTNVTGVLLAVGSAFIWALYWIYNLKDKRDDVVKLFLNFVFGFVFIALYVLITGQLRIPEARGAIGSAYVGIFEMGITFTLWLTALRLSTTTAQVSNIIYLVPFFSLVVIRLSVGEQIYTSTIMGLVFIVAGILLQRHEEHSSVAAKYRHLP